MPTLSDAKFDSLRAQGFTGAMSDMILQWLHAYGATSNNINDAWKEVLVSRGYDADTYQWNDAWFTILGDLGYDQKTLTDREYAFWAAGGNVGNWQFVFNGVDQYATMPEWTPLGLPFEVRVEATPLTLPTSTSRIVSGAGDAFTHYYDGATTGVMRSRYVGVNGTSNVASNYAPSIGEPFQGASVGTEDHTYTIGGSSSVDDDNAFNFGGQAITSIAANGAATATQFWHGPIKALRLTDNSPIQDTYANMGDGVRYGELEQPIVLEGDFEISFDWIRQDSTDPARYSVLLGDDSIATANNYIRVMGSTSGTPNALEINIEGGTSRIDDMFTGVAFGQHCSVQIMRVGINIYAYLDDVLKGTATRLGTLFIADFGSGRVGNDKLPANSALQNIVIKNLTQGLTWDYGLDEGSGTDIINSDPSTQFYMYNPADGVPVWLAAVADDDYVFDTQPIGVGAPVFTTDAALELPDWEGIYRAPGAGGAPVYGARKVTNLWQQSESIENNQWAKNRTIASGTLLAADTSLSTYHFISQPGAAEGAAIVSFESTPGGYDYVIVVANDNDSGGGAYDRAIFNVNTGTVVSVSGILTAAMSVAPTGGYRCYVMAVGEVTVVYIHPSPDGTGNTYMGNGTDGVHIDKLQFEDVTGQSNQNPSEYIPTEASTVTAYFCNENGNTVANNVVTEAVGPPLAEQPWLYAVPSAALNPNSVVYDSGNASDTEGAYYCEVNTSGVGGLIDGFLSVAGASIELTDGTDSATLPWSEDTTLKVGVAYGDGSMALNVNGTWAADTAYDGSLLSGILDLGRGATEKVLVRNIQRYDLPYSSSKAQINYLMTGTSIPVPAGTYNGSWTPDADWVFIPDNTRFYPMSSGPDGGATLACRDGNNQLTPANDATIQNYTDNWERPS